MIGRREFIALLGGAAAVTVTAPLVAAGQDYPNRSVTLIVNFPPGGSTDAMARIIREPLSQGLGQSIIIDNRGGAGGTTGAAAVANAKPDGYTLLLSVNSALTTNRYCRHLIGASRDRHHCVLAGHLALNAQEDGDSYVIVGKLLPRIG